jgi:hypothetical protein
VGGGQALDEGDDALAFGRDAAASFVQVATRHACLN